MSLVLVEVAASRASFPRVSGDEPRMGGGMGRKEGFSPRERG